MQKEDVLVAFNKHFLELWDDIVRIFPDDYEVKSARLAIKGLTTVSTSSIYKVFKSYVYDNYSGQIALGDLDFFLNKRYDNDLRNMDKSVLSKINSLRDPISKMNAKNKESAVKYMQNLCAIVKTAESLNQQAS